MMDVLIRGKKVRLSSSQMIAEGGEAEVYNISGGEVAKIFKQPSHPSFQGNVGAQNGAEYRLNEHQSKLKAWPAKLSREVIGPTSLVMDIRSQKIVGYTMKFLLGMEVLLKYSERKYREARGVSGNDVVEIYKKLHQLVKGVHDVGVVIGDFNDLNVLVDSSKQTFLVDADSMQFGGFVSRVFTARFVDPLLCDLISPSADLISPHSANSDWYAYAVMLMQSLLFVGPYGGVHAPSDVSKKLKEWQRVQKRVTVFNSDVRYPKPALHFSVLPDIVLDKFHNVFEKDMREEFPLQLISQINFTKCSVCGKIHARSSCPDCQIISPSIVKEVVTGSIEAMKILDSSGRVIFATMQGGIPRYVYHENGVYYRDGGKKIIEGKLDGSIRFRISGNSTILAKDGECVIIDQNGSQTRLVTDIFRNKVTVIDANKDAIFAVQGNNLNRFKSSDMDYADMLGNVIPSQTIVWAGEQLGFVFSRAGGITQTYVFHASGKTLGSEVDIGQIHGQVLDATVVFSSIYVWFLMALDDFGRRVNKAFMFDEFGKLCGQAEVEADDGSWLGNIRGKCAHKAQLFSPVDDGISRVEVSNGLLAETKVFADTTRFVDSSSKLLFGKDGIYVVDSGRIWRLRMK